MGDGWLVKVDTEGNMQWDMKFGELDMISVVSARQTRDGGYIIGGNSEGSWLMKLGNKELKDMMTSVASNEIDNMSQADAFNGSGINRQNESTSVVNNKLQRAIPFPGFLEVMLSIMLIVFFNA